MSRLVAFGCSHTYGHGLSDCILPENLPGPTPSKVAWPTHLAELLNLDVVNASKPGASNFEILYHILNFKFEATDIVFILWTEPARDLIFLSEPEFTGGPAIKPIGTWMSKETHGIDIKAWVMLHSNYDLIVRSLCHMHHAENYLENLNIKNKSFVINSKELLSNIPTFIKFKNVNDIYLWDILFQLYDKADDNRHPGPIAHQELATRFFNFVK